MDGTVGHEEEAAPRSEALRSSYRLTALRPSSAPPPPDEAVLRAIADVLLAAAQADGTACQRELRSLRRIMKRLTECDILPDWLEAHIANFRARDFQLEAAVAPLRELPREQRRHVVELVREVCDADIEYIRRFSLLFDMQIIWRTIFSAKARHNAY